MSKKFFSLIYGEKNRIAANQHIIPADAVGKLLNAQEVLEKVKSDAEKYKLEVSQECEKLKEAAQAAGFAEGYQKWAEHIALLETEIAKVRGDLEKLLIPVSLKAAKKIVGREIELSESTIVDIVSNTLKSVSQHKKVTIYVNKKDLEPLEKGRSRLKDIFESLEVLSLRERTDIARGGCVIETEGGIINAQLENQWSALERAFASLMKQQKDEIIKVAQEEKPKEKKDEAPKVAQEEKPKITQEEKPKVKKEEAPKVAQEVKPKEKKEEVPKVKKVENKKHE